MVRAGYLSILFASALAEELHVPIPVPLPLINVSLLSSNLGRALSQSSSCGQYWAYCIFSGSLYPPGASQCSLAGAWRAASGTWTGSLPSCTCVINCPQTNTWQLRCNGGYVGVGPGGFTGAASCKVDTRGFCSSYNTCVSPIPPPPPPRTLSHPLFPFTPFPSGGTITLAPATPARLARTAPAARASPTCTRARKFSPTQTAPRTPTTAPDTQSPTHTTWTLNYPTKQCGLLLPRHHANEPHEHLH